MIKDEEFIRIASHMKQRYGIDLYQKKVIFPAVVLLVRQGAVGLHDGYDLRRQGNGLPRKPLGISAAVPVLMMVMGDVHSHADEVIVVAAHISIVQAYCALTDKKHYSREEAFRILEGEAGIKFNPDIFRICRKISRQLC